METPNQPKRVLRGIIIPLLLSTLFGGLIYYGGDAYQAIGLAGIGTARMVLGYLLGIGTFLTLAVLLQRLVQYVFLDWIIASAIGSQPPRLLSQLSAFFVYLLAFTAIVGVVFKQDLTVVLAASGAMGIVVGLALQSLILDIFAGLALNLDRIIKLGDNVQLHKIGDQTIEGKVVEISWRTMQIVDVYQNTVVIPNRSVSSATITNFSSPKPLLGTIIPVILDSKVPVDRAMRILKAATIEALAIISPLSEVLEPTILVSEILHTPRAVKYGIYIFVPFEKRARSRNLIQQQVLKHLSFAGIRAAQQELPNTEHLVTLIALTDLFSGMDEISVHWMAKHAHLKKVDANKSITQRGEIAEVIFLVIEGLLTAENRHRIGAKPSSPTILGPGSLIGGTAMLMNDVYEATVLSKTACLLFEIDFHLLESVLMQYPKVVDIIVHNISQLIMAKDAMSNQQWQMQEEDMIAEVLRNLKRRFGHIKSI